MSTSTWYLWLTKRFWVDYYNWSFTIFYNSDLTCTMPGLVLLLTTTCFKYLEVHCVIWKSGRILVVLNSNGHFWMHYAYLVTDWESDTLFLSVASSCKKHSPVANLQFRLTEVSGNLRNEIHGSQSCTVLLKLFFALHPFLEMVDTVAISFQH